MIERLSDVIREIEHKWAAKRILVVGDVMLDKYIWGEVARISPEAPVPVVRATHRSEQPGGAANVAMNLVRLGAKTTVAGFTGCDEDAKLLAASLDTNCIGSILVASEGFPTITKLRILGGRQQMLRLDSERVDARPLADYERLVASVLECMEDCDAVVLSDYAKGVLTPEVCQQVIQAGRRRGIPVVVDPKSVDYARYRGATTICPNLGELTAAAIHAARTLGASDLSGNDLSGNDLAGNNLSGTDLASLLATAESLVPAFDLDFMVATLGDKGIALVRPGQRYLAPAVARQVFDVSGAGDTVVAVLTLCLASGLKIESAIELANMAAGIVVGKVGTVPVEKHELLAALGPQIAIRAEDKMLSREDLVNRVAVWKANGERVVFTNGCFDLIHVGHIAVLEQARRFGDRLIVAINSDASVSALKGPTRPIVREHERGRVLAAFGYVDAVVVFDEPTPLEVIVAVRPDVIVKGGDYGVDTVVGAQEVLAWGGQVKIVPLVEGFSTTRLIEKGAGRE